MYFHLLQLHNICRWLVVISLVIASWRGFQGWLLRKPFSNTDNQLRHSTATIAHIQLAIGYILYFNSPVVAYFRSHSAVSFEFLFFGIIHIVLMTVAIILITIGSSSAKRKTTDAAKFRTMAIFFSIAFVIIFLAIPWPFSPLAQRPLIRTF